MDTSQIILIVVLVLLVAAMIVMPMLTNKRNQKMASDLYGNLAVGDKIMTIGGIIGNIVEIKDVSPVDKEILIETGSAENKTTMLISVKAIFQNLSKPAAPQSFFGKTESKADVFEDVKSDEESSDAEVKEEAVAEEKEEAVAEEKEEAVAEEKAEVEEKVETEEKKEEVVSEEKPKRKIVKK